jgi:hypothetical protein
LSIGIHKRYTLLLGVRTLLILPVIGAPTGGRVDGKAPLGTPKNRRLKAEGS